jgi:surface antigen
MKKLHKFVLPGLLVVALAGCEGGQYGQKQTGGALVGAAAGGLLGSQIGGGSGQLAATAGGAVLGLLLGSEVGKSLDRADRMYAERSYQQAQAAPVGQQITWSNPQSGNYGTVTPTRDGRDQAGNYCREYQQTVTVGGKTQQAYGTACRQPDGTWKVVN